MACVPEGRVLRRAGIRAPVLVLGYTPGWQAREAVGLHLDLAVFDLDTARAFGAAARALDTTASVHVKVDTGMHRLGVPADAAAAFVRGVHGVDGIDVVGLFTHFACADDPSPAGVSATDAQVAAIGRVLADLDGTGHRPPVVHASNPRARRYSSKSISSSTVPPLPPRPESVPTGWGALLTEMPFEASRFSSRAMAVACETGDRPAICPASAGFLPR
ncbi:MAG: alanine racemase [Rhodomicrobium sp.]